MTAPSAAQDRPWTKGPWEQSGSLVEAEPGSSGAVARKPHTHYSTLVTGAVIRLINREPLGRLPVDELRAEQWQANHLYGAQQLRLVLPGGDHEQTVYRLIIAPADAPVSIGGVSADVHFAEPMTEGGE